MRVSFDFDSTLLTAMDRPNKEFVAAYKEHMQNGDDIIIVTSRRYSPESMQQIEEFLKKHGLESEEIIHTNGADKADFLEKENVDLHYDDDEYEIEEIEKKYPHIQTVYTYNQQAMNDFEEYRDSL